jgi:hypothetical protein
MRLIFAILSRLKNGFAMFVAINVLVLSLRKLARNVARIAHILKAALLPAGAM